MKINIQKFDQGTFATVAILGIGTVAGCIVGGILLMLSGVGAIMAGFFMTIGILVVPAWALFRGTAGQKSALKHLQSNLGVELLPDGHELTQKVQRLASEAGLPPVKFVGWYKSDDINAFASGLKQSNAMVCFTSAALDKLEKHEVDAVIAHELGHVANGDMKRMSYARNVQSSLSWVFIFGNLKYWARWVLTTLSELWVLKLSRTREYHADAFAAVLTSPEAMISALQAIGADSAQPPKAHAEYANLMMRGNPANMFSTHPSIAERVQALQSKQYIKTIPTT